MTRSTPITTPADGELRSLYDPRFEHDACGVGFVVRSDGRAGRDILNMALTALARLTHRGAVAADGLSGDGAGVMTRIPRRLFLEEAERLGWKLGESDRLAVAMVFLPPDDAAPARRLEAAVRDQGLRVLGWRDVPIEPQALGMGARATMPDIRQLAIVAPPEMDEATMERRLYLARKQFERDGSGGYVCSISCRTLVYKGLSSGEHLAHFYLDLAHPLYETDVALFHQRYSTNTLPSWELAQPFRMLAHNGEINTLWANRAWMKARDLPREVQPVLDEHGSDSSNLDEALELLVRNGREADHGMSMLVVPAWEEENLGLSEGEAAFYRYHVPLMEPWDGPSALAFCDGRLVGAGLDRNGLRPCRWKVMNDGLVVAGSEVGLFDLDDDQVAEKGRLGPGQMLLVDLAEGTVLETDEIIERLAARRPFAVWAGARPLGPNPQAEDAASSPELPDLMPLHRYMGFTSEDLKYVIGPMSENQKEPTWSMGDDTPIAPLARSPRPVYTFLRQRFAQVTNPPIDSLREACVMSLRTWLGPRPPLLSDGPQNPVLEIDSPILTLSQSSWLTSQPYLDVSFVDCTADPGSLSLPATLDRICAESEAAIRGGARLLVLTDRAVGPDAAAVPMALALGAVHHHLLEAGLRARAGLVVEAGDCVDVHHVAVLMGYGAGAVCPWLSMSTARSIDPVGGEGKLQKALEASLRKVMSKMGIATISSYRSGQLFEILGLSDEVVARCFAGTPSRIGGLGWEDLEKLIVARHRGASGDQGDKLPDHGLLRYRRGDQAEVHAWQPLTVLALQGAVGSAKRPRPGGEAQSWATFRKNLQGDQPHNLRDLLDCVAAGPSIPVEEVEPAESIFRGFVVSAMSMGALSPEAHNALTIAMNRLGGRSNTGEGGEDRGLYRPRPDGVRGDSKIKQVASGRFGVTAEYLARAEEIEIKMAQGSKPGEGGQIPGHKVTEFIARLRHAQPGRPLISPPPHHDIYSIEDLAQLIYDLKRCNPDAAVGVKLVAEAGVGTVAAGVAKAYADYVAISGHSGGTGASPLSSIKHAGAPWELGLSETQQTLVRNGLRSRVRLRADGGLMSARDVLYAALLGADEFAFGTAPLVALGCDMARQCHLNSCPTGIASQRPDLRAKFRGSPEHVERYFRLLAEDLRELLAQLGLHTVAEAVGRTDLLRQVRFTSGIDLSRLLARVEGDEPRWTGVNRRVEPTEPLDEGILREARPAMASGEAMRIERTIRNSDRAVGARVSGALSLLDGEPDGTRGTLTLAFTGTAGQSFGAFSRTGLRLELTGEANDYVGKGLCGADLVIRPTGAARAAPQHNVLIGNVVLYGATSGRLYAAGVAGERFAVRNSGASAVIEGVGDHACEYMTGGMVVILGETGVNFGAGMTGGVAFVYDEAGDFPSRTHEGSVATVRPERLELDVLRDLVTAHVRETESVHAASLLARWEEIRPRFWKVTPQLVDGDLPPEDTDEGADEDEPVPGGRRVREASAGPAGS